MAPMKLAFQKAGVRHVAGDTSKDIPIESPDMWPVENLIQHVKEKMGPPPLKESSAAFARRLGTVETELNRKKGDDGKPFPLAYTRAYVTRFKEVIAAKGERLPK